MEINFMINVHALTAHVCNTLNITQFYVSNFKNACAYNRSELEDLIRSWHGFWKEPVIHHLGHRLPFGPFSDDLIV